MTKEELMKNASAQGLKLNGDVASKIIEDNNLDGVAGGFAGSDKYTVEEYSKAGVTWVHNIWSKDEYYVRGVKIDQDTAEAIVDMSFSLPTQRPLTDSELLLIFKIRV